MATAETSNAPKECLRKFNFSHSEDAEPLSVVIREVLHPSYGLYTWACAPVLAQFIWYHRNIFSGSRVLELGCGTALPGIIAARAGANVVLTDSILLPRILKCAEKNVELNSVGNCTKVAGLSWGIISPTLKTIGTPLDYILGADCFYDPAVFEEILVTVSYLIGLNPNAQFLTTYQERSSDWTLEVLLNKWELQCTQISLDTFGAGAVLANLKTPSSHSIHMLKISR